MTLKELYEKAVKTGMENDPRGFDEAAQALKAAKKELAGLKEADKPFFDLERLKNPFDDTRILNGPAETRLKRIMVGIDIAEGELLIAERLGEKGRKIDAVIAHHPLGLGLAGLPGVMGIQPGIYAAAGVPIGQAEGVLAGRIGDVASRVQPVNQQRTVDSAKLLGVALACFHTVADNMVQTYLNKLFAKEKPDTLGDIIELLNAIPEYETGRMEKAGPVIVVGSPKSKAGNIMVEMTGGTEGAKEMYAKLARSANISTIVGMHLSKEHVDAAKAENLNVVLAGHISSDNLGLNLLLDAVTGAKVEVVEASGFRRVKRKRG